MMMTQKVRELSFKGASSTIIRNAARSEGMKVLFEDGIVKAMKGVTTIEEVCRVARMED